VKRRLYFLLVVGMLYAI